MNSTQSDFGNGQKDLAVWKRKLDDATNKTL
jgi:hypothetical protein